MFNRPLSQLTHPREVVRQFTPNWFTATMGTGILALALSQFPLPVPGLSTLAEALWLFNIGLFILCTLLYVTRWICFFDSAVKIFNHPVMPMFWGAIPMGLATILNGFLVFGVVRWGESAVTIAYALWWIDAALALLTAWLVPYLMFTRQEHSIEKMTAIWLLPVVAAEVTAASGGLLVPYLADTAQASHILFLSYALWAISVPLALGILVILFLRLTLHKLPHRDMAVSSWLSLGPIGTGALGLMLLGADAPRILAAQGMASLGQAMQGFGLIAGLILWGYGLWWLVTAILITLRYLREGLPFNMGWWGFTFPIGVYSIATLTLAKQTQMGLFAVAGGFFVLILAGFWLLVTLRTLHGAYHGYLFVAPCLSGETGLVDDNCAVASAQNSTAKGLVSDTDSDTPAATSA